MRVRERCGGTERTQRTLRTSSRASGRAAARSCSANDWRLTARRARAAEAPAFVTREVRRRKPRHLVSGWRSGDERGAGSRRLGRVRDTTSGGKRVMADGRRGEPEPELRPQGQALITRLNHAPDRPCSSNRVGFEVCDRDRGSVANVRDRFLPRHAAYQSRRASNRCIYKQIEIRVGGAERWTLTPWRAGAEERDILSHTGRGRTRHPCARRVIARQARCRRPRCTRRRAPVDWGVRPECGMKSWDRAALRQRLG